MLLTYPSHTLTPALPLPSAHQNILFHSFPNFQVVLQFHNFDFHSRLLEVIKAVQCESVAVLDAVAIAAINDATFNFLRDGFIWLELFSITSYPSP